MFQFQRKIYSSNHFFFVYLALSQTTLPAANESLFCDKDVKLSADNGKINKFIRFIMLFYLHIAHLSVSGQFSLSC